MPISAGGQAEYLTIDQIPQYVQDATVAVEDRRFYRHFGLDPIRIIGALIADIKAGAPVQGASTITQQLAKNAFLTPAKTIGRKIEEAVLAIVLEQRYTKEKIPSFTSTPLTTARVPLGLKTRRRSSLTRMLPS